MKNLFCILLLAVMLVLVIAQYSCADGEKVAPLLYRFDGRDEAGQWTEMLGFKKTLRNIVVPENYDYLTDILREYQPDFFCAYTEEQSPRELCQAGLIEAFTPTEAIRREISEMAPYVQTVFRNELMTQDGQLLGYPVAGYNVCEAPIFIGYWIPDAWQASPFRNMTPPSSFAELLDFIEMFLDTPHDGFRLFYSPRGKDDYLEALIREPLEQAWIAQCLYAGRPVVFSDSQFITLANQAQMLGQRLLKEDYASKRSSKTRYLIADRQQYGYSYNEKDTFTCANIIPLRISTDQPPLIAQRLELYYVSKTSPWAAHAGELFETAIPHVKTVRGMTHYDRWVFPDKFDLDAYNHDAKKNGVKKYDMITREWLNSVRNLDQYIIPTLERNIFPYSQYGEFMRAANQFYTKGGMAAEAYAAELDRIIAAGISGANDKDVWIEEFDDE